MVAAAAITSQSGIVSEETVTSSFRPSESDVSAIAMSADIRDDSTSPDKKLIGRSGAEVRCCGGGGDSAEQTDTEAESETEGTTAETAEETFNVTVTFWYRENLMVNVGRVTVRELLSSNGITLNTAQGAESES